MQNQQFSSTLVPTYYGIAYSSMRDWFLLELAAKGDKGAQNELTYRKTGK